MIKIDLKTGEARDEQDKLVEPGRVLILAPDGPIADASDYMVNEGGRWRAATPEEEVWMKDFAGRRPPVYMVGPTPAGPDEGKVAIAPTKPSLYGPCSRGCGNVAERDGYVTILGVYCPCGGLFAGLRFGETSKSTGDRHGVDPKALTCEACGKAPRPESFDPALCLVGGWQCDCGAVVKRPLDHDDLPVLPAQGGEALARLRAVVEPMADDPDEAVARGAIAFGAKLRGLERVADHARTLSERTSIEAAEGDDLRRLAELEGVEPDPEARQRAVLRADLDRPVEKKGGRR